MTARAVVAADARAGSVGEIAGDDVAWKRKGPAGPDRRDYKHEERDVPTQEVLDAHRRKSQRRRLSTITPGRGEGVKRVREPLDAALPAERCRQGSSTRRCLGPARPALGT